MPDISFSSFNVRSFEQFAQALVTGVMGPGTLVFGDGPDGGREAEFTGRVPYPGGGLNWDGYITMQAKFRQNPGVGDAEWLIAQLNGDVEMMRHRAIPEFYIVVTNVRLSGMTGDKRKGGQQKLSKFFRASLKPLGVKEMHVWHEEKIASLLDGQPELLRSYRAWLSPREVLGALYDQLTSQIPKFGDAMFRMLQRDLREQRFAKLSQAGHLDDTPVPLDAVFVDLPYGAATDRDDFPVLLDNLQMQGLLVSDLLTFSAMKIDPVSRDLAGATGLWSRFLVMGGPGQGKSTIGQFLAQIARLRLLETRDASTLTPETMVVMQQLKERLSGLDLPTAGPPRYPLTIDLPTYADYLAKAGTTGDGISLLDFMARQIRDAASLDRLDLAVLRRWLAEQPWLLVLDGLDEVPPSANRRDLIVQIERFWDEASAANADLAMIISTRPQGYNDELNPRLYLKLEMSRLQPEQALAYAEKLAVAKVPSSERELVLSRMKDASENPSTQLLMISPLQVAIMIQIAGDGVPSANRWELFDGYRNVIVKRELGKRGKASDTLRKHRSVIDLVLRRAGLLLHLEAEQVGASESFLTPDRLRQIAHDVLIEEEVEGEALASGPDEIVELATDRLVLLEQRVEGRIAFEVRSLQEYLAAAELMAGGDVEVSDRIQEIIGRNHWSHVFRIAAAKTFADSDARKYRDTIMAAIDSVESDPSSEAVGRASIIAIELVLDGVAQQMPRYLRILLNKAFAHLALGSESIDGRFPAMLWSIEHSFRDPLKTALSSGNPAVRSAAWAALFKAIRARGDWADTMAVGYWPLERAAAQELASFDLQDGSDSFDRMMADLEQATVPELVRVKRIARRAFHNNKGPLRKALGAASIADQPSVGVLDVVKPTVSFRLATLDRARNEFSTSFRNADQTDYLPLAGFAAHPTAAALAAVVRSWADPKVFQSYLSMSLPWPIVSMRALVNGKADPAVLSEEIERGDFGETDDWVAAEERWRRYGLVEADLAIWTTGKFFGRDVAMVGTPSPSVISWHHDRPPPQDWLTTIVDAAERSILPAKAKISWFAALAIARYPLDVPLSGARFAALFNHVEGWMATSLVNSCEAEALTEPAVRAILAKATHWDYGTSDDLIDRPELRHAIARLSGDPMMAELVLKLAMQDQRVAEEVSTLSSVMPSDCESNAAHVAVCFLQGLISAEKTSLQISRDRNAETAQRFLLSETFGRKAGAAERESALTILANGDCGGHQRQHAISQLTSLLDAKSSRLKEPEIWKRLKLPPPLLGMVQASVC